MKFSIYSLHLLTNPARADLLINKYVLVSLTLITEIKKLEITFGWTFQCRRNEIQQYSIGIDSRILSTKYLLLCCEPVYPIELIRYF